MRAIFWFWVSAGALLVAFADFAQAATSRVDDGGSIPYESSVTLRYPRGMPPRDGGGTLDGALSIRVRLNVAQWQKRAGKLYLVFPEQGVSNVTVRWSSTGRLLGGTVTPGRRAIVFSGVFDGSLIEDTLQLKISSSDTDPEGRSRIALHFELDAD